MIGNLVNLDKLLHSVRKSGPSRCPKAFWGWWQSKGQIINTLFSRVYWFIRKQQQLRWVHSVPGSVLMQHWTVHSRDVVPIVVAIVVEHLIHSVAESSCGTEIPTQRARGLQFRISRAFYRVKQTPFLTSLEPPPFPADHPIVLGRVVSVSHLSSGG